MSSLGWTLVGLALVCAFHHLQFEVVEANVSESPTRPSSPRSPRRPPSPPPTPPGGLDDVDTGTSCPSNPLELCDFYVTGYRTELPLLNLSSSSDQRLSGLLRDRYYDDSDPVGILEVDNSGDALYMCPSPQDTRRDGFNAELSNVFYATNHNNQAYITSRNTDKYLTQVQSRCVVLKLRSIQVRREGNSLLNLNIGDGNTLYPERRRCVVFKTGPKLPVCEMCRPVIENTESKDLFPLSETDKILVNKKCKKKKYPRHTHPCPIQGSCVFPNATCPVSPPGTNFYHSVTTTHYGCPRPVHLVMPKVDVQRCNVGTYLKTATSSERYYCAASSSDASNCLSLCMRQPWCRGYLLVVPNGDGDNPRCNVNSGGGRGYVRQTGCSTDVVTPYYGGCGWCYLLDTDYCAPTCNQWGLDSTTVPNTTDVFWALYGRTGCSYGKNDPHFVGADGTRFEFNGLPQQTICLLSDLDVHINAKMEGYYDDRTIGASVLKNGKAVRTWMRELGFLWRWPGEGGVVQEHTLHLVARRGNQRDYGDGFLAKAAIDGKVLPKLKTGSSVYFPSGLTLSFLGTEKYGPYDMEKYTVSIRGLLEVTLKIRLAHPLLQTPTDAEAHFNVLFDSVVHTDSIHGVVGQTYREGRTAKSLEYSTLGALLGHPVAADGPSGLGYLDGTPSDYIASSVLKADCKFAKFLD